MKIHFLGTSNGLKQIKSAFGDTVQFVDKENADLNIIEIFDYKILFKIPKTFSLPTFFYITTKDKNILKEIKQFKISGIFFPPLKPEQILNKLKNVVKGNDLPTTIESNETLKAKIIAKAEAIPPLPAVVQELLQLTSNENSEFNMVINKIKMDQGLSSKILKLVNSPFFGIRKEITSIDRGTILLGLGTIKNLVMAISTHDFYKQNFAMYKTTGIDIWMHSFTVARLSEEIGKMKTGLDNEALYLAGLMHDIGKTVLTEFLVKEVASPEEEIAQLGVNHMQVGAIVLEKWGVSSKILDAILNHHELSINLFDQIIYYANMIDNMREASEDICKTVALALNLNAEKFYQKITIILEDHVKENFPL